MRVVARGGGDERVLFPLHAVTGSTDWQPVARPDRLKGLPPCLIVGSAARRSLVGSRFGDVFFGTAGADRISAGVGADVVFAYAGSDVISAGGDADKVDAGGGRDRIDGGTGNDLLVGGPGADTIVGGLGRDSVRGDAGDDVIKVRDGNLDHVACGAGRDTVFADRRERGVARDCEIVLRSGAGR